MFSYHDPNPINKATMINREGLSCETSIATMSESSNIRKMLNLMKSNRSMKKPSDLQRTTEATNRSTAVMFKPNPLQSLFTEASGQDSTFKLIHEYLPNTIPTPSTTTKTKRRRNKKPHEIKHKKS